MNEQQERITNHTAYRRMKGQLAQTYGMGRFVAISDGQVIADADSFARVCEQLMSSGSDPARVLIVQAGIEYPESVVIFSQVNLS